MCDAVCRPVDLYNTNPHFGTMKDLQHFLGTAYGQGDDSPLHIRSSRCCV